MYILIIAKLYLMNERDIVLIEAETGVNDIAFAKLGSVYEKSRDFMERISSDAAS
jgi:hypothetical protein